MLSINKYNSISVIKNIYITGNKFLSNFKKEKFTEIIDIGSITIWGNLFIDGNIFFWNEMEQIDISNYVYKSQNDSYEDVYLNGDIFVESIYAGGLINIYDKVPKHILRKYKMHKIFNEK